MPTNAERIQKVEMEMKELKLIATSLRGDIAQLQNQIERAKELGRFLKIGRKLRNGLQPR